MQKEGGNGLSAFSAGRVNFGAKKRKGERKRVRKRKREREERGEDSCEKTTCGM